MVDQAKLSQNPLVSKLLAAGPDPTLTFCGYIGSSSKEGSIVLYPRLDNMAESVEIALNDILHVEDVPETLRLFGAKILWVKKEAKISWQRVQKLDGVTTVNSATGPVEVTRGRLRMQMTRSCTSPCGNCSSPCSTCHSNCSICVSDCTIYCKAESA